MVGTKIFVLQMKDLVRMAVFGVLGLVLIILLVFLFIPKGRDAMPGSEPSSRYIPGTYTSSIILNGQPVEVSVTVTDTYITDLGMAEMDFTQRVFYPLFEPTMADLRTEVLFYQTADINTETDHPVTAGILHQAITSALNQALAP
jgi:uncharacterized protein with FMN-binding domain